MSPSGEVNVAGSPSKVAVAVPASSLSLVPMNTQLTSDFPPLSRKKKLIPTYKKLYTTLFSFFFFPLKDVACWTFGPTVAYVEDQLS